MHAFIRHLVPALILTLSTASAQAVVAPGHWRLDHHLDPLLSGADLTISVGQSLDGDETPTLFDFDAQAGSLRFVTLALDEGSELFLVKPGDLLSNHTAGTQLPSLLAFDSAPVNVGRDFYLGAGTRSAGDPGFAWDNTLWTSFGWAHLKVNTLGTLEIVDSAMAFREGGIVVGTLQAVPEPSTATFAAIGLLVTGFLRKTRRSNKG